MMEVQDWGGGLTQHEVDAIEKIKQAFQASENKKKVKGQRFDRLKSLKSIFPWKGYSGFRFADVKERKEGEFDLVIVTHCNVLIIELKHWNGTITYCQDRWYLNNKDMGRSPVFITRNKQHMLEKKLDKFKQQFTNKGFRPQIHFLIVMTGNADFSQLPDNEKSHVVTLTEFLQLKDEKQFNARFHPHPDSKTLNQDFELFDKKIFGSNTIKPKNISIGGYYAEDAAIFSHPKHIYQEYLAQTENKKHQDQALLRRWNFTKINFPEAQTPDGRYRLVSREYDVLNHIKLQNKDLYHTCLNYKSTPQKGEITAEHIDLFELFPQQKRFDQFVGGYNGENLSTERRLGLVQLLLDKFAQLHKIGIAHRDLGNHSIWLSADDKITLSGFATAYFSSEETVGDIREILEVSGDLAKSHFPLSDGIKLTPYQYDVRSLAVLAWHIIQAKRISQVSLDEMKNKLADETTWYAEILREALSDIPFKSAIDVLDKFNQAKPEQAVDFSFDFTKLEPFTHDINHSRAYREDDDFIVDTREKEVYRSNGLLVKAWLNADPQTDNSKARVVLNWLENMAKLANLSPDYLSKIREFGIAKKSGCLFAASDFIDGHTWQDICKLDLSDKQKQTLIHQFIQSIEHLHSLGFTHGDLKPDNVLVTIEDDSVQLHVLDILDFSPSGQSQFNTEYSPEFDHPTEKQRDNFAVMKMACELLGVEWNRPSESFVEVAEVIQQEYSDSKTAFISLARFKEALNPKPVTPMIDITVGGRESFLPIEIYPENGELFVQFKESQKYPNEEIDITFIGLGGKFTAFYTISEKRFRHGLSPFERYHISRNDRDDSKCSLQIGLNITHSNYSNLDKLNDFIAGSTEFKNSIIQFVQEHFFKQPEKEQAENNENFEAEPVDIIAEETVIEQRPNIQKLWQAILDTETEALPSITASEALQKTENGETYIPYDGEINPIDQFKRDEIVEAIGKSEDREKTFVYGTVDVVKSTLNEIHLKKYKDKNTVRIQSGTPVYLQSFQNKASYTRRKNALQRILDGESAVKNLVHYFDEYCNLPSEKYEIHVSDEEFKRYDQPEKNVSLNKAQRIAFQRLIANGPLSLLQGPPGTGKTEFIAAFVHYLFDVQKVRNILLVSQSHEAVNTAAERIRKHCQRLGTDLQLVRFSNREIADSEILEDVFSPNLVGQKRAQLNVNKISNICQLGRSMGLPEDYLRKRAELAFDIGVQIRRYQKIVNSSKNENIDEDEKRLHQKLEKSIKEQAQAMGLREFEIDEILPKFISELDHKHNIQPIENIQARKLIDLTQDMLEALSNERTNYDEFLARSRQLVIGTCVGIGQRHIGIADNLYDWVIVDEAARSISSELAIAMQSGTRILLVGDHKQLPPLYSEEHKNALARRLGISKRGEELDQALGSDFERVFLSEYGKQTCATLKTQYRMAPAIGSLVSACFYENVLENGKTDNDVPNIYFRLPEKIKSCVTWLDTTLLPNAYHEQGKNGSLSNRAEADTIIDLLQDLANDETFINSEVVQKCLEKNEQAVGVICMYGEQKKLIRKKFNERSWSDDFHRLVKIDSVDSYQGKENRVIILSLTRYDKTYSTGFLHLPNRINVALSRAMDKLVIVGAKTVWEQPKNSKTPLAKVLRFIQKQNNPQDYAIKILKNGAKK
ncbi:putative DNA helicase [Neisseria elongata]|uniref:Putative DNA helicase n=1 Tax=Neisseria elongata TaxID=495 RepID=A0A378U0C2_NEIEL|nr:AAA domain-containing protein [Neisseria elongata]SFH04457.1 Superfamily I DNA and/or RNA helicase [Neisseria elongata subsp. elongata]STZ68719.1 putative DNA helicase [Neisseria elongata]